jgi:4-amino-4-deoxy-L-arabinose transferase-like glycosyltransferase
MRVAYMITFETWNFKNDWVFGHEMGRIGQWLAEGKGVTLNGSSPTARFPPLYPLVVAGSFYLFGAYTKTAAVLLFLFQSVCSAAIAMCLVNLGNRLVGVKAGMIAGVIWAVYPTSIFYSVIRIWYCELALALVLLIVTITVRNLPSPGFKLVAGLGALSGLTVLTDSTMAVYLPLILLWMLFACRVQLSKMIMLVVVWGITAGVVVSPWMVRNWLVLGSPVFLKSNFGAQLFIQNSSQTSRAEAAQEFAALQKKWVSTGSKPSEIVYSRYLGNSALRWIAEHPLDFASATIRRILEFWVVNPGQGWESWLRMTFFVPLIMLSVYGLRYASGRRWYLAPLWLFLLVYPLPYYLTHVDHGRYSYPVEPFVVLLAAIAFSLWRYCNSGAVSSIARSA